MFNFKAVNCNKDWSDIIGEYFFVKMLTSEQKYGKLQT